MVERYNATHIYVNRQLNGFVCGCLSAFYGSVSAEAEAWDASVWEEKVPDIERGCTECRVTGRAELTAKLWDHPTSHSGFTPTWLSDPG